MRTEDIPYYTGTPIHVPSRLMAADIGSKSEPVRHKIASFERLSPLDFLQKIS